MAYRSLDEDFWRSPKVRTLSDQGKLAYAFLITIGQLTGLHRRLPEEFAVLIGWPVDKWQTALDELVDAERIKISAASGMIWVIGHIEHQFLGPDKNLSPKQRIGIQNALLRFPPDRLLDEVRDAYPQIFGFNGSDPAQTVSKKMEPKNAR